MTSGAGYDSTTSTFSSDGRVFQIEYAHKATELGGTALAIKCVDGIVLACENFPASQLIIPNSQSKILPLTPSIAMVSAGLIADGRYVSNLGKEHVWINFF
jgi:20S proteasome subunit alpha 7